MTQIKLWLIPLSILGHLGLSAQTACRDGIGLHIAYDKPLIVFEKKRDTTVPALTIAIPTFSTINTNTPQVITPSVSVMFSANNLPFFCKIEHTMAKGQKLPLKFRLGSVEYVDEMEGKRIKPK
jgi:hypothetical protein